VIPAVADKLSFDKDDATGEKEMTVKGAYEHNLMHLEGERASRNGLMIREFRVTIPEALAGNLLHLTAKEAHYIPDEKGWELTSTIPTELDDETKAALQNVLEVRDVGRYFLHVRDVDFDALTRNSNWFILASTFRLYTELGKPETPPPAMAVLFHIRLTRPVLGLLLVFLGLSMILRDSNRNVILSAGACLVLCAVFFTVCQACKMLGEYEYLSPPLAAWLPVILFGPMALVLFDAVHT
jgi:lipopolysaccharide export system permease protein